MLNYIVLAVMSLFWASVFLFVKLADQTLSPLVVVADRGMIGVVFLWLIGWALKKPFGSIGCSIKVHLKLMLLGCLVGYLWFCIAQSEQTLSAGIASLMPATSTLFAWLICVFILRDRKFRWINALGIAVAISGVVEIIGLHNLLVDPGSAWSTLLLASGFLSLALSSVLTSWQFSKVDAYVVTTYSITYAAIISVVLAFWFVHPMSAHYNPTATWSVLGAGIVSTALGYILYFWLAQHAGPVFSSLFGYLVPVFGFGLSAIFLQERITLVHLVGGTLILLGIYLVNMTRASDVARAQ